AAASPAHLTGMKVVAPSGTGVIGRFETFSFALPRTRFDTILRAAAEAAGAEVREGMKVEEVLYDDGAVGGVVTRDTGLGTRDAYRSRIVVGADGLRSVVARCGARHVRDSRYARDRRKPAAVHACPAA